MLEAGFRRGRLSHDEWTIANQALVRVDCNENDYSVSRRVVMKNRVAFAIVVFSVLFISRTALAAPFVVVDSVIFKPVFTSFAITPRPIFW